MDHVGRRRQHHHPAHDRADRVQSVLETRGDTKVASAPAYRPEQVGVRLGVHAPELTVRGDDVSGDEIVDRETVLPHEVADAAAKREPTKPDRAGIAESGRESVSSPNY